VGGVRNIFLYSMSENILVKQIIQHCLFGNLCHLSIRLVSPDI
jgi:hypothetical protein